MDSKELSGQRETIIKSPLYKRCKRRRGLHLILSSSPMMVLNKGLQIVNERGWKVLKEKGPPAIVTQMSFVLKNGSIPPTNKRPNFYGELN